MDNQSNEQQTNESKPSEQAQANEQQQADQTPAQPPAPEEKKFSQADVERIIKERLERERKKAEQDRQKAEEDARAKALKEQGEFKQLAEEQALRLAKLEEQVKEVEALQEQVKRYSESLQKQLEEQKKSLPDAILALLEKQDPLEQLDWLAKHRESLTKSSASGIPPTPRAGNSQTMTEAEREERRKRFGQQIRAFF